MEERLILQYNLQFFAKDGDGGEKTEPATAKKLEKAREEGQVARSKEIGNATGLLVLFICLKIFISFIFPPLTLVTTCVLSSVS